MKIYIAAPYELRDDAIEIMQKLIVKGHIVTSRWLMVNESSDEWAAKDLEDVAEADVLLAYNPVEFASKGTGGRHVEFGYALAHNKRMIILGVRSNIFHHIDDVIGVDRFEAVLARMAEWQTPRT